MELGYKPYRAPKLEDDETPSCFGGLHPKREKLLKLHSTEEWEFMEPPTPINASQGLSEKNGEKEEPVAQPPDTVQSRLPRKKKSQENVQLSDINKERLPRKKEYEECVQREEKETQVVHSLSDRRSRESAD